MLRQGPELKEDGPRIKTRVIASARSASELFPRSCFFQLRFTCMLLVLQLNKFAVFIHFNFEFFTTYTRFSDLGFINRD
ncbi:hypothetical protein SAMN05216387_102227 [Nitrosovibrio tenuis]|uniref:Uncharacterized protein n=1 Tax=Nitrosovibrio tenuis TaxID=1233 RepID=A0A1H7IMK2_9PROT|nr:hypothetical protein SAMN05216387_102227 [Nitrosovibrio tenuis]